jgi:hypothetical protein
MSWALVATYDQELREIWESLSKAIMVCGDPSTDSRNSDRRKLVTHSKSYSKRFIQLGCRNVVSEFEDSPKLDNSRRPASKLEN